MGASLLLISLVASAGTSLIQAKQQSAAGKRAQEEANFQAEQEELAGIQRERERQRALAASLATTSARRASGGIRAFSGSALTQLAELNRESDISSERDIGATRISAGSQRARGKVARRTANQGAVLGLLSDGVNLAGQIPYGGLGGKGGSR